MFDTNSLARNEVKSMAELDLNDDETELEREPYTPEAKENQMISLAISEAERQLRNGTASAQVICHYLRLGSAQARLEKKKLEKEIALLEAKKAGIESAKRVEELYADAIEAMRSYRTTSE